nr:class II fructose-bisphosphate aldolase [Angustibacter aerolatus]
MGRLGRAGRREPADRRRACSSSAPPPGSSWRSRSASSAARRTASRTRSTTRLYSTPADAIATIEALGTGEKGRYLTALTFGNVHGVYKPGNVRLRPEVLEAAQQAAGEKSGKDRPFDLVFHGGSGSLAEEIAAAVRFGVVKMNVDTDTQYAFTRPVVDHMLKNYDGVLKIDGEVGSKKAYDPRVWGKAAEAGLSARVVEACQNLSSAGTKA